VNERSYNCGDSEGKEKLKYRIFDAKFPPHDHYKRDTGYIKKNECRENKYLEGG